MTATDSGPRLWDYAVGLYSKPGVSQACLDIQEKGGVDVPLLLFGAWLGSRRVALPAADCERFDAAIAQWRAEVIHPLRRVRRRMKSGPPPAPSPETDRLREAVKAAELNAERVELDVLETLGEERLSSVTPGESPCIAGNMRVVLSHFAGPGPDEATTAALERIVSAATQDRAAPQQ